MIILDGKQLAQTIQSQIKEQVASLFTLTNKTPKLAVVVVGNNSSSQVYVKNKVIACNRVGILSEKYELDELSSQAKLNNLIISLAEDKSVNGILLQLPLPKHLNPDEAINLIPADKDVDGLTDTNISKMLRGKSDGLFPCTALGVITLLKSYNIEMEGKNVVIVGRSLLVGKPLAHMFLNQNATVTICHSKTNNLKEHTLLADILVVATGNINLITAKHVKPGAVVVDVAINKLEGKLVGDVNFEEVSPLASYISPVPGGIGPLTVTMLLNNTIVAFIKQQQK